jgi:glycosyltransferase involved in cell wall biosynthesis
LSGRRIRILEQPTRVSSSRPEPELQDGFVKGRISIIMPAFNEADCIAKSIAAATEQFRTVLRDFEIIVVDDGSTDETRLIAEDVYNERVKVVGYKQNRGKGYALKEGFNHVTGEFTFLVDSDLEIRAKELNAYVATLEAADIVIGSKRHPLSVVQTPALRMFLSLGFNILERLLTGVRVSDTQAGIKGTRSIALYGILPLLSVKKYAFDAELIAVASLLDYRIKELPVFIQLRAAFSVRQVFRMFVDLLGIAYRLRVKRWYQKNMAKMSETYKPVIRW